MSLSAEKRKQININCSARDIARLAAVFPEIGTSTGQLTALIRLVIPEWDGVYEKENNQVRRICEYCGVEFYVAPSKSKRKYHSKSCYGKAGHKQIRRICKRCGTVFFAAPSTIKLGRGIYCSNECFQEQRRVLARPSSYTPYWRKQRDRCLVRDNHTCQICGKEGSVAHHIIPRRLFNLEDEKRMHHLDNLITVCKRCHMEAEYSTDLQDQWMRERGLEWPDSKEYINPQAMLL